LTPWRQRTLSNEGFTGGLQSEGLQSGGLQSLATDLGFANPHTCALYRLYCLGAFSLGAYSLAPPILDMILHSPLLYKIGGLQCGGLQSGGLQSRAADVGSHLALTCALQRLRPIVWGLQSGGLQSRATDFGSDLALMCALTKNKEDPSTLALVLGSCFGVVLVGWIYPGLPTNMLICFEVVFGKYAWI